jgi:hypothetical protein
MTTDERFAVLSALLDREPVDPDALAAALEDPAGRAELVDFARLRHRLGEELADDEPVAAALRAPRLKVWLARAAMVLLPLTAGAAAGVWFVEQRDARPPAPDRIVKFVPGVDWKAGER